MVTSIAAPNPVLQRIASDSLERGMAFYVIGDVKSPADFDLPGCEFYSIDRQRQLVFKTAALSPVKHYARKNIGYLLAMQAGASTLLETDDDNMPGPDFYVPLPLQQTLPLLAETGWINIYRYYSDLLIWPRGLPLDEVQRPLPTLPAAQTTFCPIQQGLADDNPDVDAVYRLLLPLEITFKTGLRLALGRNAWCPFNSQNTVFHQPAFPLLYLPAYCSFRMTDIWRSFVAQRIAWENGWSILFREATVKQFRNDHSLMKDFEDEIPGYLHNNTIKQQLAGLTLHSGVEHIAANMRTCYRLLVTLGLVGAQELPLLDAWLEDLASLDSPGSAA